MPCHAPQAGEGIACHDSVARRDLYSSSFLWQSYRLNGGRVVVVSSSYGTCFLREET